MQALRITMVLAAAVAFSAAPGWAKERCRDLAGAEHGTIVSGTPSAKTATGKAVLEIDEALAYATIAASLRFTPSDPVTTIIDMEDVFDFGNGDSFTAVGQLLQVQVAPLLYSMEGRLRIVSGTGQYADASGVIKYDGGVHVTLPPSFSIDAISRLKGSVCLAETE